MPSYSTINRIQVPSLTDAPNAVLATAPPASGVEHNCLMPFATSDARDAAIISPTEGLCCYIDDEDDVQIFTEGVWTSMGPRYIQLFTTDLTSGTSEMAITDFKMRKNSRYWIRWIVHYTQSTGNIFLRLQFTQSDEYVYLESGFATGTDNVTVGETYIETTGFDYDATVWGSRTTASGTASVRYGVILVQKVR